MLAWGYCCFQHRCNWPSQAACWDHLKWSRQRVVLCPNWVCCAKTCELENAVFLFFNTLWAGLLTDGFTRFVVNALVVKACYGSILSTLFPIEWYQMFCSGRWYKVYCPLNVCVPNLRLLPVAHVVSLWIAHSRGALIQEEPALLVTGGSGLAHLKRCNQTLIPSILSESTEICVSGTAVSP